MINDPDELFTRLFREDRALDRSIGFTSSFMTVGNVLGYEPKQHVRDIVQAADKQYDLKRSEPWDVNDRRDRPNVSSDATKAPQWGEGDPPIDARISEETKHTEMRVATLIREALWDEAKWMGTVFATDPRDELPPVLAPMYRNEEPAREIFAIWRRDLGQKDVNDKLRVSVIRGIDRERPFAYRVMFGLNVEPASANGDERFAIMLSRVHTMDASSPANLDRFLASFGKFGMYFLAPSILKHGTIVPREILDVRIAKAELNVRQAWEIGRNDPDSCTIVPEDKPLIPKGMSNPPIKELMAWMRNNRRNT